MCTQTQQNAPPATFVELGKLELWPFLEWAHLTMNHRCPFFNHHTSVSGTVYACVVVCLFFKEPRPTLVVAFAFGPRCFISSNEPLFKLEKRRKKRNKKPLWMRKGLRSLLLKTHPDLLGQCGLLDPNIRLENERSLALLNALVDAAVKPQEGGLQLPAVLNLTLHYKGGEGILRHDVEVPQRLRRGVQGLAVNSVSG